MEASHADAGPGPYGMDRGSVKYRMRESVAYMSTYLGLLPLPRETKDIS